MGLLMLRFIESRRSHAKGSVPVTAARCGRFLRRVTKVYGDPDLFSYFYSSRKDPTSRIV